MKKKSNEKILTECYDKLGFEKKGGQNPKPTEARPEPPKGSALPEKSTSSDSQKAD